MQYAIECSGTNPCIAEELHSNLFIYPSRILYSIGLRFEVQESREAKQKKMVEEVNASTVFSEERLSNSVYYFDREKQEVTDRSSGKMLSRINR